MIRVVLGQKGFGDQHLGNDEKVMMAPYPCRLSRVRDKRKVDSIFALKDIYGKNR